MASLLGRAGVTPNAISGASVVFALLGAVAFVSAYYHWLPWWLGWLIGAIMIQLRLICNLMDGMVAIEGGHKTPTGDLWNEIPDRFADTFLFVGAGWASGSWIFGVIAAWSSIMTAYVRSTGANVLAGKHDFCGPFAKPQRMAALTIASLITAFYGLPQGNADIMYWSLAVIAIGTLLTVFRRIFRIARELKSASS